MAFRNLRKQTYFRSSLYVCVRRLTFGDATTGFPARCRLFSLATSIMEYDFFKKNIYIVGTTNVGRLSPII